MIGRLGGAFAKMRTRTTQTYDAAIPEFLEEAEHLYAELQRRLA
jgi:hypothetical protein